MKNIWVKTVQRTSEEEKNKGATNHGVSHGRTGATTDLIYIHI